MMSETVTVQFDMKLDDILLYWRQTTTFFIKKKYIFNIIFVIVHTYEIRFHEVRR